MGSRAWGGPGGSRRSRRPAGTARWPAAPGGGGAGHRWVERLQRCREEGRAAGLEGGDRVFVAEGQADVVQALHEAPAGVVVDLERLHEVLREAAAGDAHLAS